jgi:hypothetical protein
MSDAPRAYTREEMQQQYLDHVRDAVNHWFRAELHDDREKLEGLAFSILVMLDGDTNLPGCRVLPIPRPDDQEYHEEIGENWYPEDVNIAGDLHERFLNL